jgi:hypothetical protein
VIISTIFGARNGGFIRMFGDTEQSANAVQVAALLVRGSTPQGRFHIQVTASADPFGNSDSLLFAMIPDIDLLDGFSSIKRPARSRWVSAASRSFLAIRVPASRTPRYG